MTMHSYYFYGNEVSEYGKQYNRVDYRTLAKAFDAVLNNEIMSKTTDIGYWEPISGYADNSEEIEKVEEQIRAKEAEIEMLKEELNTEFDTPSTPFTIAAVEGEIDALNDRKYELENEQDPEVFQWYIVSDQGASILKEAEEVVFYNDELDMYLWGVTHWGTSWDYVLTNIKIEREGE